MESYHLQLALFYAYYKIKVFPCREVPGDKPDKNGKILKVKSPYTANGFYDATDNEETIRQWWDKHPNALVGIPCKENGMIVLDSDRHNNAADGVAALHQIFKENVIDISSIPKVITPTNSGEHYIFNDSNITDKPRGNLCDGVEIKYNGYIIAAGSVMPNDIKYQINNIELMQLAIAIQQKTLPMLPAPLIALLYKKTELTQKATPTPIKTCKYPVTSPTENSAGRSEYVLAAIRGEAEKLAMTQEGGRNNQLRDSAFSLGTLVEPEGLHKEDAEVTLRRACELNGLISDDDSEFLNTFSRCFDEGARRPRESLAEHSRRMMEAVAISGAPISISSATEWEAPVPLPSSILPVGAFDTNFIPEQLRSWAMDIVEPMQCPPDYFAASMIVSLSSVIGRQILIKPQEKGDWTVTPNLWGMIVGRPGIMKSPVMEEAIAPIRMLERLAKENFNRETQKYKLACSEYELRKKAAHKNMALLI